MTIGYAKHFRIVPYQRVTTVRNLSTHPPYERLADVAKAFFRVWPEKDTDGHPKLNALTRDIGGHHFALVVGTVDGFDIQAWMNQMLFKTLQIIDPNGEGQAVRSDFRPYNPRPAPRDRSYLKFIGKVPEVDGDTLREKGMTC